MLRSSGSDSTTVHGSRTPVTCPPTRSRAPSESVAHTSSRAATTRTVAPARRAATTTTAAASSSGTPR
jgi:hypothetical protein